MSLNTSIKKGALSLSKNAPKMPTTAVTQKGGALGRMLNAAKNVGSNDQGNGTLAPAHGGATEKLLKEQMGGAGLGIAVSDANGFDALKTGTRMIGGIGSAITKTPTVLGNIGRKVTSLPFKHPLATAGIGGAALYGLGRQRGGAFPADPGRSNAPQVSQHQQAQGQNL